MTLGGDHVIIENMAAADQKLLSSGMQRDSGTFEEAAQRLSEVE